MRACAYADGPPDAPPGTTIEEFNDEPTEQEAEQLLDSDTENVFTGGDDYYSYPDYQSTDDEDSNNADEIFNEVVGASGGGAAPLSSSLLRPCVYANRDLDAQKQRR